MPKKKKSGSNTLEVQNAAKTLYANIRFMSPDNPIRSLVLTSSVPNEGKSTCAFELAKAIASSGKTVLLVEADMRRRTMASLLGVHASAGVYAVLSEQVQLRDAVVATQTPNLYFLDTEPNIPNPADIISSKRFHKMAAGLIDSYDYVIYDTPPVGTFVDAAILSTIADGTVMVVKPGMVKRTELVDAYEQLQKAGANVLGVCATFCEGTGSEYYYAYYTKDGERVDPDKVERKASRQQPAAQGARPAVPVAGRGRAAGQVPVPVAGRQPVRGARPINPSANGRRIGR